MVNWILIIFLTVPSGKQSFIIPSVQFQSQTACEIAIVDLELYLKTVGEYAITCARMPEEREA